MVREQLRRRGISDKRLLDAFCKVERHKFLPSLLESQSYSDGPLSIGEGQTISQPYIVAYMIEDLNLGPDDKVLEIGTGSGYQTALLSLLVKKIYSVERSPVLAQRAQDILDRISVSNIKIVIGDGTKGLREFSPFDAIIVSAASPGVPAPLLEQLSEQGRIIIPVGERFSQVLIRINKTKQGFKEERLEGCVFVPLIGEFGWSSEATLDT